ncbi:MAG: GDSL-type esterase/lipase family protein [Actinomycetota bacterium]|nr:GDSL-type esterase/lipase family protein [Actinomycetota bacterium]
MTAGATAAHAAPPPADIVRMAALGDSITRATGTCSDPSGCLTNSWATGKSTTVNSHYLRLRAAGATSSLVASNFAVNGATSEALNAQAQSAIGQSAQYVTIEIGANDACTSTVSAMTPSATFKANVESALATLASAGPDSPEIFLASIPNLLRLYELNKGNPTARLIWGALKICQSLLANPTSTKTADVQRREAVQQRVNEYNAALAEVCSMVTKCRFDDLAIAGYRFTRSDISTRDYFHPSVSGQANFAAITWAKTQWVTPST